MVKVIFSLLMSAALAAFLLLMVLGIAGVVDPRLAAAAFGVAVLAAGVDELAGAFVVDWERGWWTPPPGGGPAVRAGRLSSLGSGLLLGSFGALLIGLDRVPPPARLVEGAVLVVGLVLAMVGESDDRRRADAVRRGSDVEPSTAAVRRGR